MSFYRLSRLLVQTLAFTEAARSSFYSRQAKGRVQRNIGYITALQCRSWVDGGSNRFREKPGVEICGLFGILLVYRVKRLGQVAAECDGLLKLLAIIRSTSRSAAKWNIILFLKLLQCVVTDHVSAGLVVNHNYGFWAVGIAVREHTILPRRLG